MLDFPKPTTWDLIAFVGVLAGAAVAGANAFLSLGGPVGAAPSGPLTLGIVLAQAVICSVCLFILGKTAKHGTLWGNLAAVGGMLLAVSGILLAGAMWVAA